MVREHELAELHGTANSQAHAKEGRVMSGNSPKLGCYCPHLLSLPANHVLALYGAAPTLELMYCMAYLRAYREAARQCEYSWVSYEPMLSTA